MANTPSSRTAVRATRRAGLLTVGEIATIIGVSPSTLRLWESVGLVTPARSNGRYRLYSHELLAVLKRIKYLRDVKLLSLPGIRQFLGAQRTKTTTAKKSGRRATDLAGKLKRLRTRAGFSMREAARRAKISPSYLAALELSHANPSVATLQRLASTYGTTVLDFYGLPKRANHLVRPRDRGVILTESGVRLERLSTGARRLESTIWHVPPGAGSDGTYSHEGEEFIFIMSGTLELWLDELECYTLRDGDGFWFDSSVGHRWYNPSSEETVLLWINTPPTF